MELNRIFAPEAAACIEIVAQPVVTPLTRAAIFLVVTINQKPGNSTVIRSFCADLAALVRAVEFRDIEGGLTCVIGIGSDAWDLLFGQPRPADLHAFREIRAGTRHAVSTPGDLLFHIRARRMDLCFELATQIMARIGDVVSPRRRGARIPLLRRSRSVSALSTARRIRATRQRWRPHSSERRIERSPVAAT